MNPVLSLGGDAFYFPKNKDADVTAAQLELASLMISKEVQVNFNLKKVRCQSVAMLTCHLPMTA